MTLNLQEALNADVLRELFRIISAERMATYLAAAGRNEHRAICLYLWNAQMGEAFHIAIQGVEVGLRNCVNSALVAEYGDRWWTDADYQATIDHDRVNDLELVCRRIRNRNLQEENGQVVAGLSFGFWVGMLQGRYNPSLWSKHLRTAFPHLPAERSRKSLAKSAREIAFLRNRISHHEPLLKRDHSADYKLVQETLGWLCPVKRDLLKPYFRIPDLIRQKP